MPSKNLTATVLKHFNNLRLLIGFLGSKKAFGWWDCSFLDETGLKYLEMTFPRSAEQAALKSTIDAAQRVHDEVIGRIGTFHLFRLPVSVEERLDPTSGLSIRELTSESAMECLANLADASIIAPEGPVQVGVESRILTETSIRELAAHYFSAFKKGHCCFPYFGSDR